MRSGGGTAGAATLAVLRLRPDGGGWASAGRKTETPWPPRGPRRSLCSSGPPWRLLFFGSDHFAVESLKVLAADSGILNVHPSLLPRWRGPAPIFHTILNGDTVTGVSVMQIRAHGFDVGPILNQAVHAVPESSTTDELADVLAAEGAQLQLLDTLRKLPRKMADKREQSPAGATFAPKISASMSWIVWEEHTCQHIDRLHRAIGSRFPLRTTWMGGTIKLVDFAGRCHISFAGQSRRRLFVPLRLGYCLDVRIVISLGFSDAGAERMPGSVSFHKESNTLAVCCKDGWVGFKAVILKKRLTAADFYNGYLHRVLRPRGAAAAFVSPPGGGKASGGEPPHTHLAKKTTAEQRRRHK
ncbi:methionyl-tRNA formyltransferase, mitochondrial isoform X5 [Hippocampus comes]|uniref:methionyl-tRNA formyltransferase, mitochondrial isoform X5 n=1 Tax=Hippocampus comes TaxID=109280 RepID=UPI00094F2FF8|nr:PREDICTED: methionyl-tRNA formyltransferase, mitochondrial isoform X5 [Hippocampus comes]